MESLQKFLKRFFLNYCWIGIIVILLTIIVDLNLSAQTLIQRICIELFKTIGISIVVASVFSWASESSEFIDKIQKLLKTIVVKRDFLSNLDSESKMDALKLIIQPTISEKKIYANIEDYYDFYIKQTMEIVNKNVRSDYYINARIFFDSDKQALACEQTINYRLYPHSKGFEGIKIGFTESNILNGFVSYVRIYKQNNGVEEIKKDDIELKEIVFDGVKALIASIDLSKYSAEKQLTIEIKTTDYGFDHWISASIQALIPTDGLTYRVHCDDDIEIISSDTFGQGVQFNIDKSEDNKELTVSTFQWINEGTGISIIASRKKKED